MKPRKQGIKQHGYLTAPDANLRHCRIGPRIWGRAAPQPLDPTGAVNISLHIPEDPVGYLQILGGTMIEAESCIRTLDEDDFRRSRAPKL